MFNRKVSRRSFLTISALTAASVALDMNKISAYAATMGDKRKYPTVIIGAGLGGLCCGAYLAKQGIPVTVVEQHNVPGGYATSFDRAAGKFTFEVSLHGTSINNNSTARILNNIDVLNKLQIVELPELYSLKTQDNKTLSIPQRNPDAYIELLSKHFPTEKKGITGFVNEIISISDDVEKLGRENPTAKGLLFKFFLPFRYSNMWNICGKTLSELLDDHVKDSDLKALLSALWNYQGLPPSKLSAFYYAVATGDYLKNDVVIGLKYSF